MLNAVKVRTVNTQRSIIIRTPHPSTRLAIDRDCDDVITIIDHAHVIFLSDRPRRTPQAIMIKLWDVSGSRPHILYVYVSVKHVVTSYVTSYKHACVIIILNNTFSGLQVYSPAASYLLVARKTSDFKLL